ncbi:MAG TPA: M43 family zinc metalloprotease [Kofleriaceae bacterium]|nr:M43 family zinc metalloprotease [Kofleriaceae bacterium]
MLSLLVATSLTGYVSDVQSHWTADGTRIITEATLHTGAGDVTVSQFGGTAVDPQTGERLSMREMPGPEPLLDGMRVAISPSFAMDNSWRMHVVVDSMKVLDYPAGFVRTGPTAAGHYLYWESGCVFITVDSDGTKEIAGDNEFPLISESIATWNDNTASCSYIQLREEGKKAVETGRDRVNIIKFRDQSWCRPATKDDPARCHPDSAAGITTATYVDDSGSSRDGAIVDSDVELNGVNFAISVNGQTLGTEPCTSELKNTLTHELGHLLGLEHTCLAAGDPPRIDNNGAAVPLCTQAMSNMTITAATMFNYQACGEVTKSTLEPDDINAICTIYPIAQDPGTCEHVGDGTGCCDSSGNPGGSLLLALGVLTGFWRRTRRAR